MGGNIGSWRAQPWWRDQGVARWAGVVAAGVTALILLQQLTVKGALFGINEYDDGVYLGGAIRLAHGSLPYRDFAFPHPPGMPLLYLPLAVLGRIGSTRTLMAMARVITAAFAVGNVWLIARLLRHRGIVAVLSGSLVLAVFPLARFANKTLLIEPYVVFFALLGAVLLFTGDSIVSGRRVFWAAVVLGFALAVKLWAVFPIVGVAVASRRVWRSEWQRLVGGVLAGAVLPSLPFFFASPSGFVRQVFLLQLSRGAQAGVPSVLDRLVLTLGLRVLPEVDSAASVARVLVTLLLGGLVLAYVISGALRSLDVFAAVTVAVAMIGVLLSADYYPHYAYFTAAFIGLLGGGALGALHEASDRLLAASNRSDSRRSRSELMHGRQSFGAAVLVMVVLVFGLAGYRRGRDFIDRYPTAITIGDFGPAIASAIPPGACVITDEPALTITSGRFVADGPCPQMLDPFYAWLLEDPKRVPPTGGPYDPDLVEQWRGWLSRADFVVLSRRPFRVPMNDSLRDWFDSNFELVAEPGPRVYRRRA